MAPALASFPGKTAPVWAVCWFPAALLVSGCALLPGQGPLVGDIALTGTAADFASGHYIVAPLDTVVLGRVNGYWPQSFPESFSTSFDGARDMTLGIGDVLVINIWEAAPDGLFSTLEKKQVSLQAVVDGSGAVFIPYAGRIRADGRSVEALRRAIELGLKGKAVEPQVQVLVSDNASNSVIVVGDIANPGQYPVPARGLRLMEAVARAGGTREATFESVATVTRGKASGTVRLDEVAGDPRRNIMLAPGDSVQVLHRPRTYSAFGAVEAGGLKPFKTEKLTLIEALAQVGGLRDARADAGGVFIFRFEDIALARQLAPTGEIAAGEALFAYNAVPVIYRLDFKDPQSFFIARAFAMRDKDILYVANHPTAELGKFLNTIVSPLVGTARGAAAVGG